MLEERLDLLDLINAIDQEQDDATERPSLLGPAQEGRFSPPASALTVGNIIAYEAAMSKLRDELRPAAPWWLRSLLCVLVPCCGVEDSMRRLKALMPPALRQAVHSQLEQLDRIAMLQYMGRRTGSSTSVTVS